MLIECIGGFYALDTSTSLSDPDHLPFNSGWFESEHESRIEVRTHRVADRIQGELDIYNAHVRRRLTDQLSFR